MIFKEEGRAKTEIWNQIIQNIRGTILIENWFEEDWKTNPKEAKIMTRLNLKPSMMRKPARKHQTNEA